MEVYLIDNVKRTAIVHLTLPSLQPFGTQMSHCFRRDRSEIWYQWLFIFSLEWFMGYYGSKLTWKGRYRFILRLKCLGEIKGNVFHQSDRYLPFKSWSFVHYYSIEERVSFIKMVLGSRDTDLCLLGTKCLCAHKIVLSVLVYFVNLLFIYSMDSDSLMCL